MALVAAILGIWGVDIGPEAQKDASEAIIAAIGAVGGLLAVIGRIKADSKINK
jgi:hypothetical protein